MCTSGKVKGSLFVTFTVKKTTYYTDIDGKIVTLLRSEDFI